MKIGRPRARAITLMDGFYIEISNKDESKGLKIRSESKAAMENAARQYAKYKQVTILGEYKNGVRLVCKVLHMPYSVLFVSRCTSSKCAPRNDVAIFGSRL